MPTENEGWCAEPARRRLTRPFFFALSLLKHPLGVVRIAWPFGWWRRTVILLVMQTMDRRSG